MKYTPLTAIVVLSLTVVACGGGGGGSAPGVEQSTSSSEQAVTTTTTATATATATSSSSAPGSAQTEPVALGNESNNSPTYAVPTMPQQLIPQPVKQYVPVQVLPAQQTPTSPFVSGRMEALAAKMVGSPVQAFVTAMARRAKIAEDAAAGQVALAAAGSGFDRAGSLYDAAKARCMYEVSRTQFMMQMDGLDHTTPDWQTEYSTVINDAAGKCQGTGYVDGKTDQQIFEELLQPLPMPQLR